MLYQCFLFENVSLRVLGRNGNATLVYSLPENTADFSLDAERGLLILPVMSKNCVNVVAIPQEWNKP
jgi:hypothetical protein